MVEARMWIDAKDERQGAETARREEEKTNSPRRLSPSCRLGALAPWRSPKRVERAWDLHASAFTFVDARQPLFTWRTKALPGAPQRTDLQQRGDYHDQSQHRRESLQPLAGA